MSRENQRFPFPTTGVPPSCSICYANLGIGVAARYRPTGLRMHTCAVHAEDIAKGRPWTLGAELEVRLREVCFVDGLSSGMCNRGTESCVVKHEEEK